VEVHVSDMRPYHINDPMLALEIEIEGACLAGRYASRQ
jgi:hypothetical protein